MMLEVTLDRDQHEYVTRHARGEYSSDISADRHQNGLHMTVKQRDALLSLMADRLQVSGFGLEYELNEEGRLVESIIDALRRARPQ